MFSFVSQNLQRGRGFELVFVIIVGILTYLFYRYGKRGREWEIRPLEGLEAIFEGIGRGAEMGRPIMVLPGIGDLGDPQTLAGLTVFGELTQRGAEIGVTTLSCASSSNVIAASEAIARSSYTAAGKEDLYTTGKYIRWFGGDQFSYAVGTAGTILAEKPAMIVFLGYFLMDVVLDAETGARVGAVQIGGTLGNLAYVAMFCDYLLIGEEIYAASASISKDKMAISTLAGQDWMKIISIGLMVVGVLFMLARSSVILDVMRW